MSEKRGLSLTSFVTKSFNFQNHHGSLSGSSTVISYPDLFPSIKSTANET